MNVEDDIDLGFSYHDLGGYFGAFISTIAVQRLQIARTLIRKCLTHASVRPEVRLLDQYYRQQILLVDLVISLKDDAVNFALLAFVDLIGQRNLFGLAVECCVDLNVEVPFLLEVIDQILLDLPAPDRDRLSPRNRLGSTF